MTMAQQTAVDYLIKQISEILGPLKTEGMTDLLLVDAIQKAKQMEKEQMKGMYVEGGFAQMRYFDGKEFITGEQYYNEKYNK